MKQITKQVIEAFLNDQNLTLSNTVVMARDGNTLTRMYLFGNMIAARDANGGIKISNGGYTHRARRTGKLSTGSNTTKERLNGLPGVNITQKAGQWYLNGVSWDGSWIAINL